MKTYEYIRFCARKKTDCGILVWDVTLPFTWIKGQILANAPELLVFRHAYIS
jgi:hypothetical protein